MGTLPAVSAIAGRLIVKIWCAAAREHGGRIVAPAVPAKVTTKSDSKADSPRGPDLEVLAPVRDYAWTRERLSPSRRERHPDQYQTSPFSIDQNVWGPRGGNQRFGNHLWKAPDQDVYAYTEDPRSTGTPPMRCHRIRARRTGGHRWQAGVVGCRHRKELTGRGGGKGSGARGAREQALVGIKSRGSTRRLGRWCFINAPTELEHVTFEREMRAVQAPKPTSVGRRGTGVRRLWYSP